MRRVVLTLLATVTAAFLLGLRADAASQQQATGKPVRESLGSRTSSTAVTLPGPYALRIVAARDKARRCQARLGLERSPVSTRPVVGRAYARWVWGLWKGRAQAYCTLARELGHPVGAIKAVFGPYAGQAIAVARCESGDQEGELSPHVVYASNGQYRGMFQMGSSERARFGHGATPLEQAIAAHAYFVASGRDWSPWSCKPDGSVQ